MSIIRRGEGGSWALAFSNILVFRYKGGAFDETDHKNRDGRAVHLLKSELAIGRPSEK